MKIFLSLVAFVSMVFASVDINTADEKELVNLKGIGVAKAMAIVEYRESKCFKSIDELSNVKGIGKKIIEKNKDNLTVSECK
jgi:competence protein ComEA